MKNAFEGGRDYHEPQQQMIQRVVQPKAPEITTATIEKRKLEPLYNFIRKNVPEWFILSSFFIGAIVLVTLIFKFSKMNVYLKSLFKMWRGLLK